MHDGCCVTRLNTHFGKNCFSSDSVSSLFVILLSIASIVEVVSDLKWVLSVGFYCNCYVVLVEEN